MNNTRQDLILVIEKLDDVFDEVAKLKESVAKLAFAFAQSQRTIPGIAQQLLETVQTQDNQTQ